MATTKIRLKVEEINKGDKFDVGGIKVKVYHQPEQLQSSRMVRLFVRDDFGQSSFEVELPMGQPVNVERDIEITRYFGIYNHNEWISFGDPQVKNEIAVATWSSEKPELLTLEFSVAKLIQRFEDGDIRYASMAFRGAPR